MKKKKTIITIGLITILLCTIGATYAYFTARVERQGDSTVNVKTEALAQATMEMGSKITAEGVLPGYKTVKTVRVTGSGPKNAKAVNAVISLIPYVTDFSNHIEYEIYALDNPSVVDANNICSESNKHIDNNQYYDEMTCDTTNLGEKITSGVFNKKEVVGIDIEVGSNTDRTYYILVKYVNDENNPQDQEQGKRFTINIDFGTEIEKILNFVKLGDYISLTPTSTSYTISKELTGYESDQVINPSELNLWRVINPSELNLWRVINKNENGSVELISEYISGKDVYFRGQLGFLNFVGVLNEIAKQYENRDYTIGSRYIGYNGQTEYLSSDNVSFTNPSPFVNITQDNQNEKVGGGDILYEKDINLVETSLGTLVANRINANTNANYWLASRFYNYIEPTRYGWRGRFFSGSLNSASMYFYRSSDKFLEANCNSGLRPILILKPEIIIKGMGTKESPYKLIRID